MASEPAEPKLPFGPLTPTIFGLPNGLKCCVYGVAAIFTLFLPKLKNIYILILQLGLKPFRSLIRILYHNELRLLILKYQSLVQDNFKKV